MTRMVCFTSASASATLRRSLRRSVTLAVSRATSVPPPMATPRSAWASAGASLSPSPTMATRRPCSWYFRTTSSFRSGDTCASTASIPTWRATASAVSRRSPVRSTTCSPRSRSARMAAALVARTGSAMASMPARAPSTATNTGVAASAACSRRDGIELGGDDAAGLHEVGVADGDPAAGHRAGDATPDGDIEAGDLGQGSCPRAPPRARHRRADARWPARRQR